MSTLTSWVRGLTSAAFFLCAVAAGGQFALAQGVNPGADEALKRQYDDAFRSVFSDPGNLDKSFRYAEIAIQVGNYEAAISALERMLIVEPDLPRVRLELGVLYFRLASHELAKTYLEGALATPNVPEDVRQRVDVFLEEIKLRQSSHQWSGSVFGGLKWQSNANSAPGRVAVFANGVEANVGTESTATDDSNAFISGSVRHVFDMQTQLGDTWESNGTAYISEQHRMGDLDLVFLRVDSGPRQRFAPGVFEDMTFRPYLIGNIARLDGVRYTQAGGFGGNITNQFNTRWFVELTGEFIEREFSNGAGGSRTISQQSGSQSDVRLSTRFAVTESILLSATGGVTGESADKFNFRSNYTRFLDIGVNKSYGAPDFVQVMLQEISKETSGELKLSSEPWSTSITLHRGLTEYDSPDPSVSSTVVRTENEWRVNLVQAVPIDADWTVIGTLQRSVVSSNLLNFDRNNNSVTLGVSRRF
ncbi:MAG: hypothetical protein EXQ91_09110 [Alphaproteobacteria bacterium]|nr:hypothetical protein [Alphaproteobacteria bacterium]